MRNFAIWLTGLLAASVLNGCCSGAGCGGCTRSEAPYSEGNPYEIGSGNFFGVAYYTQKYGLLRRRYTCPCSTTSRASSYDPGVKQDSAPAQNPAAPEPAAPAPYDSNPEAPVNRQ